MDRPRIVILDAHTVNPGDNPWDGQTLEWWTSSPPAPENFTRELPAIRSERPVWDHNHPDARAPGHGARAGARDTRAGAGDTDEADDG